MSLAYVLLRPGETIRLSVDLLTAERLTDIHRETANDTSPFSIEKDGRGFVLQDRHTRHRQHLGWPRGDAQKRPCAICHRASGQNRPIAISPARRN